MKVLFWIKLFLFFSLLCGSKVYSGNQTTEKKLWFDVIRSNNIQVTEKIIKSGFNVNIRDDKGRTALSLACISGFNKIAKLLLKHYANVNVKDINNQNPLIAAASYKGNLDTIQILVDAGSDINCKDKYGFSAFLWCLHWGKYKEAKFLLEKGSDINVINNLGQTALILLSIRSDLEIMKFLVNKGININIKDNSDMTCIEYAVLSNNLIAVKFLAGFKFDRYVIRKCYKIALRKKSLLIIKFLKSRYRFL